MVAIRPYLRGSWPTFSSVLLAVFVAAAALSPLLHHDVVCHIQSPTHCTTCLSGCAAEGPSQPDSPSGSPLVAMGSVVVDPDLVRAAVLPGELAGRSPPVQI
jgi:hypothetical protein